MVMKVKVDPKGDFNKEFRKAIKAVGDLTIPLQSITRRWYDANKSIFTLGSAGQYQDLSTKPFTAFWQNKNGFAAYYSGGYKEYKKVNTGFVYPILRGKNRRIEKAITDPKSEYAYNAIVNKQSLILGVIKKSDFPYAAVHLYGHGNIPARPYLFTGAEQVRPEGHKKTAEIYLSILAKHVLQVTTGKEP